MKRTNKKLNKHNKVKPNKRNLLKLRNSLVNTWGDLIVEKTVLELAQLIGGKVVGNESLVITETRGFEQAAPQSITFAIGEYV